MTARQQWIAIGVMGLLFVALAYVSSYDRSAVRKTDEYYSRLHYWCTGNRIGPDSPAYRECQKAG